MNKGDCHAIIVDELGKVTPLSKRSKIERETAYSNFGVTKSFLIGSNSRIIIDSSNSGDVDLSVNSIAIVIATEGVWRFVSKEKVGTLVLS